MNALDSFRNLLIVAMADGKMSEAELRLLSHRAAEWGVTDDQFEDVLEEALQGRANLSLPEDPEQRIEMLKEMIRMMAADGQLSETEKQLFAVVSVVLNIDAMQLNTLIDEVLAEDI